jgi:hypothetical protein
MWLEGLGKLKKIHLIGTRKRILLACSIVPQRVTLLHAPLLAIQMILKHTRIIWNHNMHPAIASKGKVIHVLN